MVGCPLCPVVQVRKNYELAPDQTWIRFVPLVPRLVLQLLSGRADKSTHTEVKLHA
jgi:hypothetical protein